MLPFAADSCTHSISSPSRVYMNIVNYSLTHSLHHEFLDAALRWRRPHSEKWQQTSRVGSDYQIQQLLVSLVLGLDNLNSWFTVCCSFCWRHDWLRSAGINSKLIKWCHLAKTRHAEARPLFITQTYTHQSVYETHQPIFSTLQFQIYSRSNILRWQGRRKRGGRGGPGPPTLKLGGHILCWAPPLFDIVSRYVMCRQCRESRWAYTYCC